MTATDELQQLRAANPVPDPDAAVDPAQRADTLTRALATATATATGSRRPAPPRRLVTWRRAGLAAMATATAAAALLVVGEQRSAPSPLAVLPALAADLSGDGILHTVERTTRLSPSGRPLGPAQVEETWTLLDDPTVARWRIGTGTDVDEGTSGDPDHRGAAPVDELPVERLARQAAAGTVPAEPGPTIGGRPTIRIPTSDGAWYIAADAPELVRHELRTPDGGLQRSDFTVFEVLADTARNRALLDPTAGR